MSSFYLYPPEFCLVSTSQSAYIQKVNTQQTYPIKAVVNLTGLSAHVIRAWEKRYHALTPLRSATNRRQYTHDDVLRLNLLKQATAAGHSIGQIANLPLDELSELGKGPAGRAGGEPSQGLPRGTADRATIAQCIAAIERLDGPSLQGLLMRTSVSLSYDDFIDQIICPLIYEIGDCWEDGRLRIAHEHMASDVLRTLLGGMIHSLARGTAGHEILLTTPAGQWHEMGSLIAAVTAAARGWHVTYLGPNLPAGEIVAAALQKQVQAVGLSIVFPADDPRLISELQTIRQGLRKGVAIFIGGKAAVAYQRFVDEIGATLITDIADFRHDLASS